MSLPLPEPPPGFDRARLLAAAARASARRRPQRAIDLYRYVLAVEPRSPELHMKLAPLLAQTGQPFDAWISYQTAAQAWLRQEFPDRALAVYREASRYLPREYKASQAVARLLLMAGRAAEAVEALVEGSRQFRGRFAQPQAIYLLRRAREIAPWDFETCLELANLLTSSAQRKEAELLLQDLALTAEGPDLLRVRAAQLRATPGLRSALRWLHALLGRPEPGAAEPILELTEAARVPAKTAASEATEPAAAADAAAAPERRPPARVTLLRPRRARAGGDVG